MTFEPTAEAARTHEQQVERSGVLQSCIESADQLAERLSQAEVTFAHLFLAMETNEEARDTLCRARVDVLAARKAAFDVIALVETGVEPPPRHSIDLATVLDCADRRAKGREQRYETEQPTSIQDVLDAAEELADKASAQRMLAGRQPFSPYSEIRSLFIRIEDRLINFGNDFDKKFGETGQMNMGLVKMIVDLDNLFSPKLDQLHATVSDVHARLTEGTSVLEQRLATVIEQHKLLPPPAPKPSIALHSGIVVAVGLSMLAIGYALGISGMGPRLASWLGQFIA
jgi:hypothetical protein